MEGGLTGTDKGIGNVYLLGLSSGAHGVRGVVRRNGTPSSSAASSSCAGLTVGSGGSAGVALLVFKKDGTNVVDSDVDSVGDAGYGEDSLHRYSARSLVLDLDD